MGHFANIVKRVFMFVCIIFSVCLVICSFRTAGIFEKNSFWNMACISVILLFVIMTYHAYILAEGIKLKGGVQCCGSSGGLFTVTLRTSDSGMGDWAAYAAD